MFKLVVLSAVLAISAAAPSLEHGAFQTVATAPVLHKELSFSTQPLVQTHTVLKPSVRLETHNVENTHVHQPEPYIQQVGAVVEQIPTGVTHQSSSIVHNIAPIVKQIVTPVEKKIVHKTPVFRENTIVKTVAATPIVHAEPIIHHEPIVHHAEPFVHAAPLIKTFEHAPLTTFADSHLGFESAPLLSHGWNAAPLSLARGW